MQAFRTETLARLRYFAYGSNIVAAQMRLMCPAAEEICMSRLEGWRFIINQDGYATIVRDETAYVIGLLWGLTPQCEASLDDYEEISIDLYKKVFIQIEGASALVYIATNELEGHPLPGYLEPIVDEANARGFDPAYIAKYLEPWIRKDTPSSAL